MKTLPLPFFLIYSPKLNELILVQFTMFSAVGHINGKTIDCVSLDKRMKKGCPWFTIDEWQSTEEFYG